MTFLLMIKQLLNNAFVFISFLFIGGQFLRERKRLITPKSPVKIRVFYGIVMGLLAGFLMIFAVQFDECVQMDFRNLAILIAAIHGGFLPSFISGLVITCFSLIPFGINYLSLVISISVLCVGIVCGLISELNIDKIRKWLLMIISNLILVKLSIVLFTKDIYVFLESFLIYSVLTFIIGALIYYLLEYINESNLLFMKYKEGSSKDFLTGLNNVREFKSLFKCLSEKAIERNEKLSLITIDIDCFKSINDIYGHSAGDTVITEVGALLKETCRSFDIISRNGGEEFTVLLIDCSSGQSIEVGERIRKAVENYEFVLPTGKKINITISVGVSTYPDTVEDVEKLIESSDAALYEAKHTGKNKVVLYSIKFTKINNNLKGY